jgi:TonB family protein
MRALLRSILLHLAILFLLLIVGVVQPEAPVEIPVELTNIRTASPLQGQRPPRPTIRQKTNPPLPSETTSSNAPSNSPPSQTSTQGNAEGGPISEEYEVAELPILLNEVRVPYPPAARVKRIQGPVIFDLIISSLGEVSSLKVIQSPGPELTESASIAVRKFKFKPARQSDKAVAIRIRYTYRFILE